MTDTPIRWFRDGRLARLRLRRPARHNAISAAMWRALARRQGLADPTLDRLLVSISPKDLAQAEEEARFWPLPPPEAQPAPTLTGKTPAPTSNELGTSTATATTAPVTPPVSSAPAPTVTPATGVPSK